MTATKSNKQKAEHTTHTYTPDARLVGMNFDRKDAIQFPAGQSRGRNGGFTATSFAVAGTPGFGDDDATIAVEVHSRRQATYAPIRLALSVPDAIVLAQALLQAAEAVTGTPQESAPIHARCLHCDAAITLDHGAWIDRTKGDGCGDAVHEPAWDTIEARP
jgi:hypothetical protein